MSGSIISLDIEAPIASGLYVGQIVLSALPYIPKGFLNCDNVAVDTTEYSVLFDEIGYTFGGSGSTFNTPNLNHTLTEANIKYLIFAGV